MNLQKIQPLIRAVAKVFAYEGYQIGVAILAQSDIDIKHYTGEGYEGYTMEYIDLHLKIPMDLYYQISNKVNDYEDIILNELQLILRSYPDYSSIKSVVIAPILEDDSRWQEKAKTWLSGKSITNQGRVRSDNIASLNCDGLLFRSEPEILLYKALKYLGVSFAPLPVFIRGGKKYKRIEPDFLIIKDGIMMVVEVDGDTVHHETPAEAHTRTTMLLHEGVHIERVRASECNTIEKAKVYADKLIKVLEKRKTIR